MKYFFSAAALTACATLVYAAPTEIVGRDTFHLDLVSSGLVYKSGPIHVLNAYQKYASDGAVAPEDVVNAAAAAASQQGSVAANPGQYDSVYNCPVTVGAQTLNLDFDTGSADLWVFSTLTPSSESSGHNLYNPSTGVKKSGYTWDIEYEDKSGASGVVYADKVVIGGVTATSQAVEAATSVSSDFTQRSATDGLVGLAFSPGNTVQPTKQLTFFDTVKSTLSQKLFAADLRAGEPGSYQFGYIDTSKFSGSLSYVNVKSGSNYWEFTAGSGIGDSIADTGTTLALIPSGIADDYYNGVSGSYYDSSYNGGYIFPCDSSLPDFSLTIGSGSFAIPGSYINFAPAEQYDGYCFGGLQYKPSDTPFSILGDIFLKSVYVVFDESQSSPRLGFAQK